MIINDQKKRSLNKYIETESFVINDADGNHQRREGEKEEEEGEKERGKKLGIPSTVRSSTCYFLSISPHHLSCLLSLFFFRSLFFLFSILLSFYDFSFPSPYQCLVQVRPEDMSPFVYHHHHYLMGFEFRNV